MSTPNEIPPPQPSFPPLFPVSGDNNVAGSRSQMPTRREESKLSTSKKPRISDDAFMNPSQNQPPLLRVSPPLPSPNPSQNNPQNNNLTNRLFFKTRLCHKFRTGSCPYGNNCSFAHGLEELREAPPNWQDILASLDDDRAPGKWGDQQRIYKVKVCRKFYSGEGCPYGNRCTFVHEEPGRSRESSVITVGTTETSPVAGIKGSGSSNPERNVFTGFTGDVNGSFQKTSFWKTKLCHRWEMTGSCPFGETCHFAHGVAELKRFGGHVDVEVNSRAAPPKLLPISTNDVLPNKMEPICRHEAQEKGFLRWKGSKKMNSIYADWIDDVLGCSPDKSEI